MGMLKSFVPVMPEEKKAAVHAFARRERLSGIGKRLRGHRILLWKRWSTDEGPVDRD